MFWDSNKQTIKYLHQHHFSVFNTSDELNLWLTEGLNRRACLMFNKRSRSEDITERLFWYRPGKLSYSHKNRLGSELYNAVGDLYYDSEKCINSNMDYDAIESGADLLIEQNKSGR